MPASATQCHDIKVWWEVPADCRKAVTCPRLRVYRETPVTAATLRKRHGPRRQADRRSAEPFMIETRPPTVSVVVPVRNEAGNIGPLVAEIAAALTGRWRFEVIYVNDGSTDGTAAELEALMADLPWLRQIKHASSCGQSAAIRTGVTAARGEIVATLDGDGQNDPAFLPQLIEALEAGAPR